MNWSKKRSRWAAVVGMVAMMLVGWGWPSAEMPSAAAQSPISFGETTFENDFPNTLTFTATAESTAGEIVKAELLYSTQRNLASNVGVTALADLVPGSPTTLRYVLDAGGAAVPSTPYLFKWRVEDSAGNVADSAEMLVRFHDNRFEWDVIENDQVSVWTHDRRAGFGQDVFDIASESVARQGALFGEELSFPIYIIIYNNFEEFDEWQSVSREWVGGQAFSELGITTQIVTNSLFTRSWLEDVVPHEISHLYFYQVSDNGSAPTPNWLNEGVAQYNEFHDNDDAIRRAQSAARNGELLLLTSLESGFGGSDERIRLAYDTSVSAIVYLVQTYGEEGMADLLRAYKAGHVTDDAIPAALGVSYDEFQRNWLTWLGTSPEAYPTPTVIALPTFPPSPTAMLVGQANSNEVAATPLPVLTPDTAETVEVTIATKTPVPEPVAPPPDSSGGGGLTACLPLGLALPLLLMAGVGRRRKDD